ncbi:MAG: hypothetical protein JNM17_24625 [Archangium sp.]|nr:hypothetical protein [Archangium sp.]
MNQHLDPQGHAARQTTISPAVVTGAVIALFILLFEAGIAYAYARYQGRQVRRGWNIVPVTVLATDVPSGTLNPGNIKTAEIPEQFLTSTLATPASAGKALAKEVTVPLKKDVPLRWSDVVIEPETVLFAARDLKAGDTLGAGDFTPRSLAKDKVFGSALKASERSKYEGKTLTVELRAGDPVLSTFFSEARK